MASLIFMYVGACLHVSVHPCYRLHVPCPRRPGEGTGSPGTELQMVESHHGGCGRAATALTHRAIYPAPVCLQKTYLHMGQGLAEGEVEPNTAGGCGKTHVETFHDSVIIQAMKTSKGGRKQEAGWGQGSGVRLYKGCTKNGPVQGFIRQGKHSEIASSEVWRLMSSLPRSECLHFLHAYPTSAEPSSVHCHRLSPGFLACALVSFLPPSSLPVHHVPGPRLPLPGLYEHRGHTGCRVQDLVNLHLCPAVHPMSLLGVTRRQVVHYWELVVASAFGTQANLVAVMFDLRLVAQC